MAEEASSLRILPPKVAADRIGVHVRTLQRMVRAAEFPKPVAVSRNRIGFIESAVNGWIASRPEAA
jgi:prophage regulatory protein